MKSLFYRRKGLLLLLQEFGGRVGKIDFQKYLFLWGTQQDTPLYNFVPYKYGGFSFQSHHDLGVLKGLGYIEETNKSWILKKKFDRDILKEEDLISLGKIKNRYKSLKGEALLKFIYSEHPYYAINSDIAKKLLTRRDREIVEAKRPKYKTKALFTIGYEGRTIETYLNLLIQNNIKILCDVRKNALSRKYGFSKNQLKGFCSNFNIDYINIPKLGIDSELRWGLSSMEDYRKLFQEYNKSILKYERDSLNSIIDFLNEKKRVAITCFEEKAEMCHRNCVAKAIRNKLDKKIDIINL